MTPGRHKVMAPRARLLRRVDGWDPACAQRFADACAGRARDHAVTALDRAGAGDAADALRACATPREIRAAVRAGRPPEAARIAHTMAGDAAIRALGGAAVVAAYIAAHTAARVDGRARDGRGARVAVGLASRGASARRLTGSAGAL